MMWDDKPFYSLNYYYKTTYSSKVYKLALNGGMSCPNRDGLIDTRGCIFCSAGGSGEFTPSTALPIDTQITAAKELVSNKITDGRYIAYFQAYTNTYASVDYLEALFFSVINREDILGLSIATRPDCLSDDILSLLAKLAAIKPLYIELGLQTIHEASAEFIRRGYKLPVFDEAVRQLKRIGANVVVHMIIGLPGETPEMMCETAKYIAASGADGIKLQLLHVIKGTDLAKIYVKEPFHILSLEEYCEIVVNIIERLPESIVIHRITGDGKKDMLIEPLWSTNKKHVLNQILKTFRIRNTYQGKFFERI